MLEATWDKELRAWIHTPKLNEWGAPLFWDWDGDLECDDANACGGSWLWPHAGGEAEESTGSSSSHTGGFDVTTPIGGGSAGNSDTEDHKVTVRVQYDASTGAYQACTSHTKAFLEECAKKAAEKRAACNRKYK